MASAKSSRSRSSHSAASAKGNAKDAGAKLEENLNVFKADKFDADAYVQSKCHSLGEKEIRQLCSYLVDLKRASAEEMRRSVYANYTAFIRTSKEISDLEGELSSMRNLLSTQATLIHNLSEGVNIDSLSHAIPDGSPTSLPNDEVRELSDIEKWSTEFPDFLDVLLAERRTDEALASLDEGERIVAEAKDKKTLAPAILQSLHTAIIEHRQKLSDQLAEAACQPSTRGAELRAAISALKKLGDGPRAHSLLLNAHYQRYQYNMQSLRPSSTSYGGAYTAALSQLVFSAIAQAASDSLSIFGQETAYTSELVMWATKQTESFALLVKRHALSSSAAAGGLRSAAECVQIALGHCSLLEARGLSLCPVLLKHFRPSVEQALDANLKRIEESTAALAAADDWELTYPPTSIHLSGRTNTAMGGISHQHKLSSSAHRFNAMVQDYFEDVAPLLSLQLGSKTLDGLFHVFNSYVSMLIKALPGSMEEEANFEGSGNKIVRMAETEAQQMALLANASLLADELLPRAAMKLSPLNPVNYRDDTRRRPMDRQTRNPEQREWKRRLVGSVDRLKDSFCRQHALDLIFTEEGDSYLTANMYINVDGNVDEIEWFPSPIFQELYAKLNRIAGLAADMFVGRERFATLLLMRLTETVILWLSEDHTFWDDIEEGPRVLGPLGLQQFYLDMKFVMCFASQGRYLSRNLHRVINDIISKAMAAFAATGMDPYSALPEDDWFNEICQDAIERLSGRGKSANGERDPNSPTASVSAQSISSIRSHGSS
ncbi:exocyst complex component EXO84B [Andrographis paniculata]|uniref:exocyst complex component EXO84B n=1 Tax=Andrographis paniculata TaxID=175694 RepID=UPI0021E91C89|nr:exocyst complex component EXO84B [Andrographis paniculata]